MPVLCRAGQAVPCTAAGAQLPHDHHRFVQMLEQLSGRWPFRVLRNGHLFLIFTKAPSQLAARLVLGHVDRAASALRDLTL